MLPSYVARTCRSKVFRNVVITEFANASNWKNGSPVQDRFLDIDLFSFQWWRKKLTNVQLLYDEVTGLKEVRDAQNRVVNAEKCFVLAQEKRRNVQLELTALQLKLKEIYAELDKTQRGDDRYVTLVTMEHSIVKEEKRIHEIFQEKEREERDYFNSLSSAVKMGHERERAQAERTKYWSIIGSVFGTFVGVLASGIINNRRMKEIRDVVNKALNTEITDKTTEVSNSMLQRSQTPQFETLMLSLKELNKSMKVMNTTEHKVVSGEKSDIVFSSGVYVALALIAVYWFFK